MVSMFLGCGVCVCVCVCVCVGGGGRMWQWMPGERGRFPLSSYQIVTVSSRMTDLVFLGLRLVMFYMANIMPVLINYTKRSNLSNSVCLLTRIICLQQRVVIIFFISFCIPITIPLYVDSDTTTTEQDMPVTSYLNFSSLFFQFFTKLKKTSKIILNYYQSARSEWWNRSTEISKFILIHDKTLYLNQRCCTFKLNRCCCNHSKCSLNVIHIKLLHICIFNRWQLITRQWLMLLEQTKLLLQQRSIPHTAYPLNVPREAYMQYVLQAVWLTRRRWNSQ